MNKPVRGFTLIELLVVIAIIGILSSVVLASLNSARSRARTAQAMANLKNVQTMLEAYYAEYGSYPSTSMQWNGYCSAYGQSLGDNWIPQLTTAGLAQGALPTDPRQPGGGAPCVNSTAQFIYRSDGAGYKLISHQPESMSVPASLLDPNRAHAWGYWTQGAEAW